jgi:hypothetical protein
MHVKYPPGAVRKLTRRFALVVAFFVAVSHLAQTQEAASTSAPQKIILDTDIGGDIDDAFALALALSSPDIELTRSYDRMGRHTNTGSARRPAIMRNRNAEHPRAGGRFHAIHGAD